MVIAVMQRGGACWYTTVHTEDHEEAINMVKGMIDRGETLDIWWFAAHGQRFSEKIWMPSDEIVFIRTEQDDG